MQPADLWQQWEQLKHVESLQDALLLPIARVIAAGVLSALLLLLFIVRPQTQAATSAWKPPMRSLPAAVAAASAAAQC